MPNLERSPGRITISGKPIEVDSSQVRGNIGNGISYEFKKGNFLPENVSESVDILDALMRGERVFRTKQEEIVYVKSKIDGKETGHKVLIPGKPIEVPTDQVSGDTRSGIRFEINTKDLWAESLHRSQEIFSTVESGGRVFVTENDDLLFVNPPFEES